MALKRYLAWLGKRGLTFESVSPVHIAAYIEEHDGSIPTVQQHLAAIRKTYDWLQASGVVSSNPAGPVKGPNLRRNQGKTPILSAEEMRIFLHHFSDSGGLIALRDRAFIATMVFAFPRVSAVCK